MEGLPSVNLSLWDVTMKSICAKFHFWSFAEWKKNKTTRTSNLITETNGVLVEPAAAFTAPLGAVCTLNSNSDSLAYPNCDLAIWLRTCEKEVITPLDGVTTGNIPTWIRGSLYRNGPGKQRYGRQSVNHLFDASGLLHL